MKVSARFEGTGLQLRLVAENEVEARMVGAVLNLPQKDSREVDSSLLLASVRYEGHFSNQRVSEVTLTVVRQEQPA